MKQNKGKNNRKIESKNTLSDANIAKIYDAYIQRKDIDKFSKLVDSDTVINNNYNLSVNNYVSLKDKEEKPNITLINEELKEIVKHPAGDFRHGPAEAEGRRRGIPRPDRHRGSHHRPRLLHRRPASGHQGRGQNRGP